MASLRGVIGRVAGARRGAAETSTRGLRRGTARTGAAARGTRGKDEGVGRGVRKLLRRGR